MSPARRFRPDVAGLSKPLAEDRSLCSPPDAGGTSDERIVRKPGSPPKPGARPLDPVAVERWDCANGSCAGGRGLWANVGGRAWRTGVLCATQHRSPTGSRADALAGDARGAAPLARRRLTVEDHGKRVVSERGLVWYAPLTFARPAVTNREQRVRRRRWRTKSDSGRGGGTSRKRGVQRIAPLSGLRFSRLRAGARGKRNFLGLLASRRQIRRRSEYLRRMPTICRP